MLLRRIILYCFLLLIQGLLLSKITAQGDVKFEHYTLEDGLPGAHPWWIMQDHQGFLWIGAGGIGLARFDGNKFKNFQHDPKDSFSLSDDRAGIIFEDSQKRLWVGTEKGLNQFDKE